MERCQLVMGGLTGEMTGGMMGGMVTHYPLLCKIKEKQGSECRFFLKCLLY